MRLMVNGEHRDIAAMNVADLLTELDFAGSHYAVALNFDVVPRSTWAQTPLKDGDELEIITPRQGG